MSRIRMNTDWERQLTQNIDSHMRELVRRCQTAIDGLRPAYEGKPVEEIKPAVQSAWTRATEGGQITDPNLTEYAEAIRIGRPIVMRYDGIKK
jgi:hypothetical protein